MIDWHWEVFFYYKLKRWGCELTVSQTPTFIIEPLFVQVYKLESVSCFITAILTVFYAI